MFGPLLGVLFLVALWSVYWFAAIAYAKQVVAEERAKLAMRGLTLGCSTESWGGYPFRFEYTCVKPRLAMEGAGEINSSSVLIMALAYNPRQLVILVDGPETRVRSAVHEVSIRHARGLATVTFDKDWTPRFSAELSNLEIPQLLTARKVMGFAKSKDAQGVDIAYRFEAVRWQRPGRPAMLIDAGQLTGSLSPDMILSADNIELSSGKVRYWGSGKMELDSLRRPSGSLATETNDLDGLLDILDPHLLMTEQEKANLRMVLGLLGQQAKATLSFSNGDFYIGPYKVSDLVPLY